MTGYYIKPGYSFNGNSSTLTTNDFLDAAKSISLMALRNKVVEYRYISPDSDTLLDEFIEIYEVIPSLDSTISIVECDNDEGGAYPDDDLLTVASNYPSRTQEYQPCRKLRQSP